MAREERIRADYRDDDDETRFSSLAAWLTILKRRAGRKMEIRLCMLRNFLKCSFDCMLVLIPKLFTSFLALPRQKRVIFLLSALKTQHFARSLRYGGIFSLNHFLSTYYLLLLFFSTTSSSSCSSTWTILALRMLSDFRLYLRSGCYSHNSYHLSVSLSLSAIVTATIRQQQQKCSTMATTWEAVRNGR